MKRVLIYSTAYFPFVGGAEVAVREITKRISGIRFEMITAKMKRGLPQKEVIDGVLVHRFGIGFAKIDKLLLALFGGWYGYYIHKKNRYDAVWGIMASYGGFAALSLKRKIDIPFLLTLQEGDPIESILEKVRFVRGTFNQIFTRADALQTISHYLMDWGKSMKFQGKISEVIPNGVDVPKFSKFFEVDVIQKTRKSFGFSDNAIVLVTASRLTQKNGIEYVIRALPLLPKEVCFVICGVGELENNLKVLVQELKVDERIQWLSSVTHEELPRVLKASDIFIRPSLTEGLGNSFLEAMATELPTIGTPVGGIVDFLKDGETGFFCEPKNSESIAEVVLKVVNLPEDKKQEIQKNAFGMIVQKYEWNSIAKKMERMLLEIISSRI